MKRTAASVLTILGVTPSVLARRSTVASSVRSSQQTETKSRHVIS